MAGTHATTHVTSSLRSPAALLVASCLLTACAGASPQSGSNAPPTQPAPGDPAAQIAQPPAAVLASGPAGSAFQVGDRVLCHWKGGAPEYSGRVAEIQGGAIVIHYDDGDRETTTPSLCRAEVGSGFTVVDFRVGARVRCRWKGRPTEYAGLVASIEGEQLFVHYDDGDKERISPSLCRPDSQTAVPADASVFDIVSASNPGGGSSYQGQVAVRELGGVLDLRWSIDGGQPYIGIGLRIDNIVAVGWGVGGDPGVVVYRIQGGFLRGRWASPGTRGQVGTEDLQGPPGLHGTYQIVASQSPIGGQPYTGTVTIQPTGDTYSLRWNLPRESYGGVGIRHKDLLVVGWGPGPGAGVVVYTNKGPELDGVWAAPGGTQLGKEVLRLRTGLGNRK